MFTSQLAQMGSALADCGANVAQTSIEAKAN
jgi:hypothetical protein